MSINYIFGLHKNQLLKFDDFKNKECDTNIESGN